MSAFTDRHRNPAADRQDAEHLKRKISEAIAWGIPDRESTGCSATEFVRLLSQALSLIQRQERELQELRK